MSNQTRPFIFQWQQAVRDHLQLSASTKLMLMMLSTYSSMDGRPCFPSQKRLARNCSKSVRTIKRNLMEALRYGLLMVRRERTGHGSKSNIYELCVPSKASRGHGCHLPVEKDKSRGHGCHLPRDTGVTYPGDVGVPLRSQKQKRTQLSIHECAPDPEPERNEGTQELLALWERVFASSPPARHVLQAASYKQTSTALAWTAHQVVQGQRTGNLIHNPAGYFITMLNTCRSGEKRVWALGLGDIELMLNTGFTPDRFFANRMSTA